MTDRGGFHVEEIRPLELLHRAAEYVGAVVCLTSSADIRGSRDGRKPQSLDTGAQLRMLAVIRPAASPLTLTRWQRLARGTTLASCNVDDDRGARLDRAAVLLAEQLHALTHRKV